MAPAAGFFDAATRRLDIRVTGPEADALQSVFGRERAAGLLAPKLSIVGAAKLSAAAFAGGMVLGAYLSYRFRRFIKRLSKDL